MNNRNPQLNKNGELQHLLTTEGLPAAILVKILDTAESFVGVTERDVKKIPLLRGKSVFNLFFEPSTRTRTTFDIAAKRLSADILNLDIAASSQSKGETLLDTVNNLSANLNEDEIVILASTLLKAVRRSDLPTQAISLDNDFRGRTKDMQALLKEVISHNFHDVFSGGGDLLNT